MHKSMNYAYIGNNCSGITYSRHFNNNEYNHPFIGSFFMNDEQFVRFCTNFDYYINIDPVFSQPCSTSPWAIQNKSPWYKHPEIPVPYPVMYLDDVEIHWIHEVGGIDGILDRYIRRRNRFFESRAKPVFVWSAWEMMNNHDSTEHNKLVKDFISIPNSFFLTRYETDLKISFDRIFLHKDWLNTSNERDESGLYKFDTLNHTEKIIISLYNQFIKKISHPVNVFLIGDGKYWKYTSSKIMEFVNSIHSHVYICTFNQKITIDLNPSQVKLNSIYTNPLPDSLISSDSRSFYANECYKFALKSSSTYADYCIRIDKMPKIIKLISPLTWSEIEKTNTWTEIEKTPECLNMLYNNRVNYLLNYKPIQTTKSDVLFFVNSIIHIPSDKKALRSPYFTDEERFQDTKRQIKSILDSSNNTKVVLLEMSDVSLDEINQLMLLDGYSRLSVCLLSKDEQCISYANTLYNKGSTELYVVKTVLKLFEQMEFSHLCRFLGRYWLDDNFDFSNVFQDTPTGRVILPEYNYRGMLMIEPILYTIPRKYIADYQKLMEYCLQVLSTQNNVGIEELLYHSFEHLKIPFKPLKYVGISGYGATTGHYRSI